jgi:transcriptional regulator GlxA family with amidase domain
MSTHESLAGKTIHIGVVLLPSYQLLDAAAPVDYLNTHCKPMLTAVGAPAALIARATDIHWYYIAESVDEPVHASSGPAQIPTHSYKNPPPHLDYVIVPGGDPAAPLSPDCTHFFKTYVPKLRALLTVCTGSLCIAPTGVLDGHRACSNKFVLRSLALANQLPKGISWVGDRRWIVDGNIWTAGGITAGLDLAAEFARRHFDHDIVELVKELAEETPKPDVPDEWARITEGLGLTSTGDI